MRTKLDVGGAVFGGFHAAAQNYKPRGKSLELLPQNLEVIAAFGQHERRTPVRKRRAHVLGKKGTPRVHRKAVLDRQHDGSLETKHMLMRNCCHDRSTTTGFQAET